MFAISGYDNQKNLKSPNSNQEERGNIKITSPSRLENDTTDYDALWGEIKRIVDPSNSENNFEIDNSWH